MARYDYVPTSVKYNNAGAAEFAGKYVKKVNPAARVATSVAGGASKVGNKTAGMGKGGVSGFAVLLTAVGVTLAYSGLKGRSISNTIRTLLQGQAPSESNSDHATQLVGTLGNAKPMPVGGSGSQPSGRNQAIAQMLARPLGWSTGANWTALQALWSRESGWSNTADTRKSGYDPASSNGFAFGIAQARPYYKMPHAAWPVDKGGKADPTAQIRWGLSYIRGRYGNPVNAWQHEIANNWY